MTAKEAYNVVQSKFPNITFLECVKHKDSFLFYGIDKNDGDYYAVNQNSGKVTYFYPINDLDGFLVSHTNNRLDIKEWKG
jgi:hypothetical protein